VGCLQVPVLQELAEVLGVLAAFSTRLLAIQWHITLPRARQSLD